MPKRLVSMLFCAGVLPLLGSPALASDSWRFEGTPKALSETVPHAPAYFMLFVSWLGRQVGN